jgi:two-component system, LuxR family, response regulator FixJ
MERPPEVHIVDDNASFRECLHQALQVAGFATRVYESAEQFLDGLEPSRTGCVILDLRLPGMDGIALLKQLRDSHYDIPVIVISGYADVSATVQVMKLGAVDLLQKPLAFPALFALVNKVVRQNVADHDRQAETNDIRQRFDVLSARERELLQLIVDGRSNKQIASTLNISIKTVANHRAHLMAKMKAENAADLARLSLNAGLVPIH